MKESLVSNFYIEAYNCMFEDVQNEQMFMMSFLESMNLTGIDLSTAGSYSQKNSDGFFTGIVFDKNNVIVLRYHILYRYGAVSFNSTSGGFVNKEIVLDVLKGFFNTEEVYSPLEFSLGKRTRGDVFDQVRNLKVRQVYDSSQIESLFRDKSIFCSKNVFVCKNVSQDVFADKRYVYKVYDFLPEDIFGGEREIYEDVREIGFWGNCFFVSVAKPEIISFCFFPENSMDVYLFVYMFKFIDLDGIKKSLSEFFVPESISVDSSVEWGLLDEVLRN